VRKEEKHVTHHEGFSLKLGGGEGQTEQFRWWLWGENKSGTKGPARSVLGNRMRKKEKKIHKKGRSGEKRRGGGKKNIWGSSGKTPEISSYPTGGKYTLKHSQKCKWLKKTCLSMKKKKRS